MNEGVRHEVHVALSVCKCCFFTLHNETWRRQQQLLKYCKVTYFGGRTIGQVVLRVLKLLSNH